MGALLRPGARAHEAIARRSKVEVCLSSFFKRRPGAASPGPGESNQMTKTIAGAIIAAALSLTGCGGAEMQGADSRTDAMARAQAVRAADLQSKANAASPA